MIAAGTGPLESPTPARWPVGPPRSAELDVFRSHRTQDHMRLNDTVGEREPQG